CVLSGEEPERERGDHDDVQWDLSGILRLRPYTLHVGGADGVAGVRELRWAGIPVHCDLWQCVVLNAEGPSIRGGLNHVPHKTNSNFCSGLCCSLPRACPGNDTACSC